MSDTNAVILIGTLIGILQGVGIFLLAKIFNMIQTLDKEVKGVNRDLADFKVHVAENYMMKAKSSEQ